MRRFLRSHKMWVRKDLCFKDFIVVCICVHFFPCKERTTPHGLCVCVSVHVYISVHRCRSTYWTKAQRSKWISASFQSLSSSTKANVASILHTSLSIFAQGASSFHMRTLIRITHTLCTNSQKYTYIIHFQLICLHIWGIFAHL